jgi:hypothetical protein
MWQPMAWLAPPVFKNGAGGGGGLVIEQLSALDAAAKETSSRETIPGVPAGMDNVGGQ